MWLCQLTYISQKGEEQFTMEMRTQNIERIIE